MNRCVIVIVTLILISVVSCDTSSNVKPRSQNFFVKFYAGIQPGDQTGEDIIQTSDGGLLIAGTSENNDGSSEIILIKTDNEGNQEWAFGAGALTQLNGISTTGKSVVELDDGSYLVGGTTMGSPSRSLIIKIQQDGTFSEINSHLLIIDTPDETNTVQYRNDLSKITIGNSGVLVSGNTDKPYEDGNIDQTGGNLYFWLIDENLLPVDNSTVQYWGLEGDVSIVGGFEVNDAANIGGKNTNFLVFGSGYTSASNSIDFFYQGFTDQFSPAGGKFNPDSGQDEICYGVVEYNDTFWTIGNAISNQSQINMIGWEFNPGSSSDYDWLPVNAFGTINTDDNIVGKGIAIKNGDEAIVAGNISLSAEYEEIYLAGISTGAGGVLSGWPRTFGNTGSTYNAGNVTILQDGSIVTVGTADFNPVKKIVVIKTGPNGEMSF